MINRVFPRGFGLLTALTAFAVLASAQEDPRPTVTLAAAYQTVTTAVPGHVVKFDVEVVRNRSDWEFYVALPNQRGNRASAQMFRKVQVNGDTGQIVRNRLVRLGRNAPTTSAVNALSAANTAVTAALGTTPGWASEGDLSRYRGVLVWEIEVFPNVNPLNIGFEVKIDATTGIVLEVERSDDGDGCP